MLPLVIHDGRRQPGVQRRRNNQDMLHLRFLWPTTVPLSSAEDWRR